MIGWLDASACVRTFRSAVLSSLLLIISLFFATIVSLSLSLKLKPVRDRRGSAHVDLLAWAGRCGLCGGDVVSLLSWSFDRNDRLLGCFAHVFAVFSSVL